MTEKELYNALQKLNTKDLLILVLRDKLGLTLKEIGERVMMSAEGVRKRLQRIYGKIEEEIKNDT